MPLPGQKKEKKAMLANHSKSLKALRAKKAEDAERIRRIKEEEEQELERALIEQEMAEEAEKNRLEVAQKEAEQRVKQAEKEVAKQELRLRKQKEAEVEEAVALEELKKIEKEQALAENPPASTWLCFILSAVPLLIVLAISAENTYSFRCAAVQCVGITISFTLCWPMEEANLRRSKYISDWVKANPAFKPEDLPLQTESLFQIILLRINQELGPFRFFGWENWHSATKMFIPMFLSFFVFNSVAYYARLRVFPAVVKGMGVMANESLPIIFAYLAVHIVVLLCAAVGLTPIWTYYLSSDTVCGCPRCVRKRNMLLSTAEVSIAEEQPSKSRKGAKRWEPTEQKSSTEPEDKCYTYDSVLFLRRAVRKHPLYLFKDLAAPAALAIRAGITFTFYDTFMQRGHPYNGGVVPRQGFLWGFVAGAMGQCLAHVVWTLFDRTFKDVRRLLPLVALSAGMRFGIFTVLKFHYIPVMLCKLADKNTAIGTDNFWMGEMLCSAVPQANVASYPGWSHMNVVQDLNWLDLFLGTVYE